jgi:hypothetical protein
MKLFQDDKRSGYVAVQDGESANVFALHRRSTESTDFLHREEAPSVALF